MPPADQGIILEQAIRAYTLSGAEKLGKADMFGSIEVGKKADIIVLDQDLFTLDDIQKTVDMKVLLTMFDGRAVHDSAFSVGDADTRLREWCRWRTLRTGKALQRFCYR